MDWLDNPEVWKDDFIWLYMFHSDITIKFLQRYGPTVLKSARLHIKSLDEKFGKF